MTDEQCMVTPTPRRVGVTCTWTTDVAQVFAFTASPQKYGTVTS